MAGAGRHRWTFHRVGGLDQVALRSGEDLAHLAELDPKLWVALSCPTRGLEIEARTLELLDLDRDGRVRVPEILAAVAWCDARLRDLGELVAGGGALPLSAIAAEKPDGKALLASARRLLADLGAEGASEVTPADVADPIRIFAKTLFNGDGVVPPEAAGDEATRRAIEDAISCCGGVPDRSGKPGIDRAKLDGFWKELEAFAAWQAAGEAPEVRALGAATGAAYEAVAAVRREVDDYFFRCALAAADPHARAALADASWRAIGERGDAALPLAGIAPDRGLPLRSGLNPAFAAAVGRLRLDAVEPAFGAGKESLTAGEWESLQARVAAHQAWLGKKAGAAVEILGIDRVRAILAAGKGPIEALLARDQALEAEARGVDDVVRMVHYHRDLHRLLRNFVSFADLYDPAVRAIFQAGTLYLDGRSCDLCVRVDDPTAHAGLAGLSRMCIAYCDCRRPGESAKIAACFTQGDSDYLTVGRNGIFYDRKGRDWDATIVKIVDNPISIRQAFFAPYKKFVRMIEEQVARFAAAREKAAEERLSAAAAGGAGAAASGKAAPAAVDVGRMVGIVAALGVGAGALGTLFGGFVSGFFSLEPWWAKIVALGGVVLAISGPSMLIAWLKLRHRTLGPVLDAAGWAINGRVAVNIPLGAALTGRARLPAGARRSLEDPYEDQGARRRGRLLWILAAAALVALGAARHYGKWPFERPEPFLRIGR